MDTKSLAKSKRAHTLHHNKKHHLKPTSKPPPAASVGPANSLKPTGNPIKVKPDRFQGKSALPSNWDRYEEEYDPEVENASEGSRASRLTDIIVPKSKGADYGHLISEAESQALKTNSTQSFPSFDDVLTDSNQGVGTLLSVRGQSILTWIEDDNFVVEDKATGRQEAPFLSMDLNALEEQLAKFDISKRLFIEADLLLEEQYTKEVQANQEQKSSNSEVMLNSEAAKKGSSELSDGAKQIDQYIDVTGTTTMTHPVIGEQRKSGSISKGLIPESIAQVSASSAEVQNSEPSRFEATDAEAELDMLLKSFSESKISKSPVFREDLSYKTDASTSGSIGVSSDGFGSVPINEGSDLSKSVLAIGLDDSLDELLKQTSSPINQFALRSHEVKDTTRHVMSSPSSVSSPKSKLLDDFDSWLDTI